MLFAAPLATPVMAANAIDRFLRLRKSAVVLQRHACQVVVPSLTIEKGDRLGPSHCCGRHSLDMQLARTGERDFRLAATWSNLIGPTSALPRTVVVPTYVFTAA